MHSPGGRCRKPLARSETTGRASPTAATENSSMRSLRPETPGALHRPVRRPALPSGGSDRLRRARPLLHSPGRATILEPIVRSSPCSPPAVCWMLARSASARGKGPTDRPGESRPILRPPRDSRWPSRRVRPDWSDPGRRWALLCSCPNRFRVLFGDAGRRVLLPGRARNLGLSDPRFKASTPADLDAPRCAATACWLSSTMWQTRRGRLTR